MEDELIGVIVGNGHIDIRLQAAIRLPLVCARRLTRATTFLSSLLGRVKNWGACAMHTPPTIPVALFAAIVSTPSFLIVIPGHDPRIFRRRGLGGHEILGSSPRMTTLVTKRISGGV